MILDSIEKSIKEKIEALGTPLSEWDIRINYGIKTGFNEAFIISGVKREELIAKDPNSAEIIRPILRGRDIKRYGYQFADLYLICTFPSRSYEIEKFPVVMEHLLTFGYKRLEQSGRTYFIKGEKISARKKTNNLWFETQDSISYWEDFSKQKIIYPNMTKYLPFYLDNDSFMTNQKCFILTGKHLSYLCAFLNSRLFYNVYRDNFPELLGGTRELSKIFFERVRIIEVDDQTEIFFKGVVDEIQKKQVRKEESKVEDEEIDNAISLIYNLTDKEVSYVRR